MEKSSQQQENPIKLISESFVKPKFQIEAANQPYHLGPIDVFMLSIDPMQKGLLYTFLNTTIPSSSPPNYIVSHLLDNLKNSLSIALVRFYPLAGRLTTQTFPEEDACSIFVDCNKGPGARFIHATAFQLTVSDISASSVDARIVHPLFDLGERCVNFDGHTKALLCIQVTELLDGVFIGFSMNHSVADGTSFIHFISMLSEIFTSLDNNNKSKMISISRLPVFNYRPWLSFDHDNPALKFPVLNLEGSICHGFDPGSLKERVFNFRLNSLTKLKAKANRECDANDVVISSFQALTAFVWRSVVRVQNLSLDQLTTCFFIIGARSRLDPPISDDYFGGFASQAKWACKVGELLGHNLGWAAMRLRELIISTNGETVLDFFKEVADSPMMIPRGCEPNRYGDNSLIMAGSARFDWCGSEFGLGRAVAVRMGYGGKEDGKISVNAGCEKGSVDLDICLKPPVMVALESDQEFMSFVTIT